MCVYVCVWTGWRDWSTKEDGWVVRGEKRKGGADRTYVQQKRKKKVEYVDQRKETK